MITCENCKLILDDGTQSCPRCGEGLGLPEGNNGRKASDVHSLLSSANLHRIRGEWDEAIELCMEALKLAPKSAEAYSLLGDIYESRGQDEDAMQWFAMALDLEPTSKTDRVKLKTLREKFANLGAGQTPPPTDYGSWFDRFVGGRGFDASIRVITIVSVALVVLLLLAGILAFIWRSPGDEVTVEEAAKPISDEDRSTHAPNVSTPAIPPPPRVTARAPAEQQVLTSISTSPYVTGRSIVVEDATVDPRVGLLIATFRTGGPLTRASICADAAAVANAAFATSPGVSWVMLRCYGNVANELGVPTPELLFVADVERSAAARVNPSTPTDQLQQVFVKPWWHQRVQ